MALTDADRKALAAVIPVLKKLTLPPDPDKPPDPPPTPSPAQVKQQTIDKYYASLDPPWDEYGNEYIPLARTLMVVAGLEKLELKDACALLEVESAARNTFHADWGEIGENRLPYAWLPVTKMRLADLMDHTAKGGTPNGVGVTALTYPPFVVAANKLQGGAVAPANQMRIGFGLLADYLKKYPRLRAIASYNAGEPSWRSGLVYAEKFERAAAAWGERLREEGDVNPHPDPKPPANFIEIKARDAWSKGGGSYVNSYPTHYDLRPDVKKIMEKYLNMPRFRGKISMNTYKFHPPAIKPLGSVEKRSVDIWDWKGRGYPIRDDLQKALWDILLDDPSPPRIAWMISNGRMYQDGSGVGPAPAGPANSDPQHLKHLHVTFH